MHYENIEKYLKSLEKSGLSKATIKNYESDIRQFVEWSEDKNLNLDKDSVLKTLREYKTALFANYKSTTAKRKLSSVTSFANYLAPSKTPENNLFQKSKSKLYETNALLMGAYTLSLIGLLITIPYFLKESSQPTFIEINERVVSDLDTLSASQKTIDIDGVKLAISAPQTTTGSQKEQKYLLVEPHVADPLSKDITTEPFKSWGKASIPANKSKVTVFSDKVERNSVVLITPTSDTRNQTIYISSQGDGWFQASVASSGDSEINFNWYSLSDGDVDISFL